MPERRTIDDRLSALERRLDDRETSREGPSRATTAVSEASGGPETTGNPDTRDLVARVETLEAEIAELEAGLQALRGYVGNVEHVNETVERRANAAIAAVERLEAAPKTPPPIATATTGDQPTEKVPSRREGTPPSTEQSDTEMADAGILDRLKALR